VFFFTGVYDAVARTWRRGSSQLRVERATKEALSPPYEAIELNDKKNQSTTI
jgi:hypothetical protein